MREYNNYLDKLAAGYWAWLAGQYWKNDEQKNVWKNKHLDSVYGHDETKRPVFTHDSASMNLVIPDSQQAQMYSGILSAVLVDKSEKPNARETHENLIAHHRWFRSMNSSQALAISVFGSIKGMGAVANLADIIDDNDQPLFSGLRFEKTDLTIEHDVDWLGEKTSRHTSLDACLDDDRYRIAIECKLTEQAVGTCSRPRENKDSDQYCDGSYKQGLNKADVRCVLTKHSIQYWKYIPQILDWDPENEYEPCPLDSTYQLVRNILAATVRDGQCSPANGHAVLLYDQRNPWFGEGAKNCTACTKVIAALKDKGLLRTCSWQRFLSQVRNDSRLTEVVETICQKYGFDAE